MIPITRALLTHPLTRPFLREKNGPSNYYLREVKGIVVHWTANTAHGADAAANRSYFNQGFRPASAHYIVDSDSIVQCIPELEVAFHCGDKPLGYYKKPGADMIQGTRLTPNYFTIGVEMCVNADGVWPKTYEYTVDLVARLLYSYSLPISKLYRHFDITGKRCPMPFLKDTDWVGFQAAVAFELGQLQSAKPIRANVTAIQLNVRTGPGATSDFPVRYTLRFQEPVLIYESINGWARIGVGEWVKKEFLSSI